MSSSESAFRSSTRAVSPVIGVILLIAITVILVAAVGGILLADSSGQEPAGQYSVETTQTEENLTMTFDSVNNPRDLRVYVDGKLVETLPAPNAADSVVVTGVSEESSVQLIESSVSGDSSSIAFEKEVSSEVGKSTTGSKAVLNGNTDDSRLVVNKSNPENYDTIQNAVNNASTGDTVFIKPDTYGSSLGTDANLVDIENKESITIRGEGSVTFARNVTITDSSNVRITDVTVESTAPRGINIKESDGVHFFDMTFKNDPDDSEQDLNVVNSDVYFDNVTFGGTAGVLWNDNPETTKTRVTFRDSSLPDNDKWTMITADQGTVLDLSQNYWGGSGLEPEESDATKIWYEGWGLHLADTYCTTPDCTTLNTVTDWEERSEYYSP